MDPDMEGDWVGGLTLQDTWIFMKTHITRKRMTVTIPSSHLCHVNTSYRIDSSLHFEVPKSPDKLLFEGNLRANVISGVVTSAYEKGTFRLARVFPTTVDVYAGTYHLPPDRTLVFGERLGTLCYLEGRRVVETYPLSENVFFSVMNETITFNPERGEVCIGTQKGRRISLYREESITFCNGDVTLSGTVTIPQKEGPHPGVVLIHGSGASDRESYRFLADHLARHGIAALRYDKRGVKASTGDWWQATLEDLAKDALSGLHALRHHKNIDPEHVGLLGTSQGAWVAPLAASLSGEVGFIVLISGAAVSPRVQELYRTTHELRYRGYSSSGISAGLFLYRLWLSFVKVIRGIQNVPQLLHLFPESVRFAFYLDWDFNPLPVLEQVKCPVLILFGERDKVVPVRESAHLYEKALKANPAHTIRVFPRGNHALLESDVGVLPEIMCMEKKEFVPGYYDLVSGWIAEQSGNT